jgi:excinuclease UvrABC nuclease subunit
LFLTKKGTRILKGQTSKPEKNPLSRQPGCYVITHSVSEKQYVGSSVNLAGRISSNLTTLKDNKHKNKNYLLFTKIVSLLKKEKLRILEELKS